MGIARVVDADGARWAIVEDDGVTLLNGSPFDVATADRGAHIRGEDVQLLAPVRPSKVLAVGRNYLGHAQEMGLALGQEPSVFAKPNNSVTGPNTDVVLPPMALSREVEHEAELAVVVGRKARNIREEDVPAHILGYTCANDVTARDLQRLDNHVTRAKGFDTFCPIGPWIETSPDAAALRITCTVNGELRQRGDISDMIFDVPAIISWLSQWATLLPGDVVLTGSPPGRGSLHAGDLVEIAIEGIGTLRHGVAAT